MTIPQLIEQASPRAFSFEILPPLRGRGIEMLYNEIDLLSRFKPLYINITTHRSEVVVKTGSDGIARRYTERSRPGTVAVATAIHNRYGIPVVPHMICSGYSALETEYALIDLSFLDIHNLLILRGDKAKHHNCFVPTLSGHTYAIELARQVNDFNAGRFVDGTEMDIVPDVSFDYGVAGYPEVHAEATDSDADLRILKQKVDEGASYIVTQMFFDNNAYYAFVERCRSIGINVPIIPGLKPITNRRQLNLLPKLFGVSLPAELVSRIDACSGGNDDIKQIGIDWCEMQARCLYNHGVKSIHFYSHNAADSVCRILERLQ